VGEVLQENLRSRGGDKAGERSLQTRGSRRKTERVSKRSLRQEGLMSGKGGKPAHVPGAARKLGWERHQGGGIADLGKKVGSFNRGAGWEGPKRKKERVKQSSSDGRMERRFAERQVGYEGINRPRGPSKPHLSLEKGLVRRPPETYLCIPAIGVGRKGGRSKSSRRKGKGAKGKSTRT